MRQNNTSRLNLFVEENQNQIRLATTSKWQKLSGGLLNDILQWKQCVRKNHNNGVSELRSQGFEANVLPRCQGTFAK